MTQAASSGAGARGTEQRLRAMPPNARVAGLGGFQSLVDTRANGEVAPIADIAAKVLTSCWKPRERPVW
jgi:hypothetical protein